MSASLYGLLADAVVVVHFLFVVFVVAGGLLVLRWPLAAWIHLPAAAWGAAIEIWGWICPLTPLEKRLRVLAGEAAYEGGFIQTYLLSALYPEGLTRQVQLALAAGVLLANVVVYGIVVRRWRARRAAGSTNG